MVAQAKSYIPVGTVSDDRRRGDQSLYIVNHRRQAFEAVSDRERGTVPREGVLALKAVEE